MADKETIIFLRDASLEEDVRALVADIPLNSDRIEVEAYDDADDPFHLSIYLYPTSEKQRDEWVAEIRRRLADDLAITEAPVGDEAETYWPARA